MKCNIRSMTVIERVSYVGKCGCIAVVVRFGEIT